MRKKGYKQMCGKIEKKRTVRRIHFGPIWDSPQKMVVGDFVELVDCSHMPRIGSKVTDKYVERYSS